MSTLSFIHRCRPAWAALMLCSAVACEPETGSVNERSADTELPPITDIAALAPSDLSEESSAAQVELRIKRAATLEGVARQTRAIATDNRSLGIGDRTVLVAGVGSADGCAAAFAGGTIGDAKFPAQTGNSRHVWTAEIERLPTDIGKLRFAVQWSHYFNAGDGEVRTSAESKTEVELPEGGAHVLDFVHSGGLQPGPCEPTIHVELGAQVEEDPALADRQIVYDLWYESRSADGQATHRHYLGSSKHGKTIDFEMPSVLVDVPNNDGRLRLSVAGSLRGRWRADDTVAVRLSATRYATLLQGEQAPNGTLGNTGSEVFVVKPGQTVRMMLSPLSGRVGAQVASDPNESSDGLDLGTTFADHEDALVLTVRGDE